MVDFVCKQSIMRILILSQEVWNKANSFGNTYSNIFGGMKDIEIAHIFTLNGLPSKENVVKYYYQINEGEVIKSFFCNKKSEGVGCEISLEKIKETKDIKRYTSNNSIYSKLLSFGKRHHWTLLFWARELAWRYGSIDYEKLMAFVSNFNPDIVFLPYIYVFNTNRIALKIKRNLNIPMVMYMAMDHYSLKRLSLNPLFWIDRFFKRKSIRNLSNNIDLMYCISDKLKCEMQKKLEVPCKVLYKIPEEGRAVSIYNETHNPVRFLYTGNIYANRWKTLALLAEELKNQDFGRLEIYTASPITYRIDKALNIEGYSKIKAPVGPDEVIKLQNQADVLVHVESFDLKNKLLVRCAISTKIMDYISSGRCIFGIGPHDISSIEYLKDNDIALVANSKSDIRKIILQMKTDDELIKNYCKKVSLFSKLKLNPDENRQCLYNDLMKILEKNSKKI